jgi:hypothetical protein
MLLQHLHQDVQQIGIVLDEQNVRSRHGPSGSFPPIAKPPSEHCHP